MPSPYITKSLWPDYTCGDAEYSFQHLSELTLTLQDSASVERRVIVTFSDHVFTRDPAPGDTERDAFPACSRTPYGVLCPVRYSFSSHLPQVIPDICAARCGALQEPTDTRSSPSFCRMEPNTFTLSYSHWIRSRACHLTCTCRSDRLTPAQGSLRTLSAKSSSGISPSYGQRTSIRRRYSAATERYRSCHKRKRSLSGPYRPCGLGAKLSGFLPSLHTRGLTCLHLSGVGYLTLNYQRSALCILPHRAVVNLRPPVWFRYQHSYQPKGCSDYLRFPNSMFRPSVIVG